MKKLINETKSFIPEKVAVFDISEIVKRINENKDMDVPVQSAYHQIADAFSKKYYIALIPKKVLNENSDYSTQLLLKEALLNTNVVAKDYLGNSEYANSTIMNGLCLTLLSMLLRSLSVQ